MATVYETMRIKDGVLPFLDRHLERLATNCRKVGLFEPADTRRAISNAVAADGSGRGDRALRLYWDGQSLVVRVQAIPAGASMTVVTASVVHPGYEVKTTDRDAFDRARAEAHERGADDALLLAAGGWIAEGTLFAVGWFEGDTLRVPGLDLGILPSIGRQRVLDVAQQLRIPVEEGRFPRAALNARPAFGFTATRGVVRVTKLDGVAVPDDDRIGGIAAAFWPRPVGTAWR